MAAFSHPSSVLQVVLSIVTVIIGIGTTTQAGLNARLGEELGSPLFSVFVSFSIGMAALCVARLFEWKLQTPKGTQSGTVNIIHVASPASQTVISTPFASARASLPGTSTSTPDDAGANTGADADTAALASARSYISFRRRPKPFQLCGGFLGIYFVGTSIYLVLELGFSLYTVTVVAGQLLSSVIIDHKGFLGTPHVHLNRYSVGGLVLAILGGILAGIDTLGDVSAPTGLAILYCFIAFMSGVVLPVQAAINRDLADLLPSKLSSAIVTFFVGWLISVVALLVLIIIDPDARDGLPSAIVDDSEWWQYVGGLLGATLVSSSIFFPRIISYGSFTTSLVCGQLFSSLIFDTFGILRDESSDPTAPQVIGLVLVLIGTVLFSRARLLGQRMQFKARVWAVVANNAFMDGVSGKPAPTENASGAGVVALISGSSALSAGGASGHGDSGSGTGMSKTGGSNHPTGASMSGSEPGGHVGQSGTDNSASDSDLRVAEGVPASAHTEDLPSKGTPMEAV